MVPMSPEADRAHAIDEAWLEVVHAFESPSAGGSGSSMVTATWRFSKPSVPGALTALRPGIDRREQARHRSASVWSAGGGAGRRTHSSSRPAGADFATRLDLPDRLVEVLEFLYRTHVLRLVDDAVVRRARRLSAVGQVVDAGTLPSQLEGVLLHAAQRTERLDNLHDIHTRVDTRAERPEPSVSKG